jgi:acetyl esterase/lipase
MERRLTHAGSRFRLLGRHPDPELVRRYSFEHRVSRRHPPTFIVHARDDDLVPVANGVSYAEALRQAGVDHELVLLERGGHGFGLGIPGTDAAGWPARFIRWLTERRVIENDVGQVRGAADGEQHRRETFAEPGTAFSQHT